MFNRPNKSYDFDASIIANILKDEANPLNRISQIIIDGSKVLDIGAGNGLLAHILLPNHHELILDGIEPDIYAVEIAKKLYRKFYCGYALDFLDVIVEEDYDFIVLADVIEHMIDPLFFLHELTSRISNKTKIVLSVPNIAFGAVRIALFCGEFNYVDSGILEKTHLRFFTIKTLEELITKSGLYIDKYYLLQRNILNSELKVDKFKLSPFALLNLFKDDMSSVYQFLLVVTKNEVISERKVFGEKVNHPLLRYLNMRRKNIIINGHREQ